MKITRQSAWQTNSSSSHSICISRNNLSYSTINPDDDGTVTAEPGQFGWQVQQYSYTDAKLSYAATWAMATVNEQQYESDVIISREDIDDQNFKARQALLILQQKQSTNYLMQLARVVIRHTGAQRLVIKRGSGWNSFGSIDHQSSHVCGQAFENDQTLRDFIFGNSSSFQTDNDNH